MHNTDEIRKIAIELQAVDNKKVVKVAGILRRFKNFLRRITDSDYRAEVAKLNKETEYTGKIVEELEIKINNLSEIIRDGEVNAYGEALEEVKDLTKQLWTEIHKVEGDANKVWYYTFKEMEEPGFLDKIKKVMPESYDIELQKSYGKKLKDFSWYSGLTAADIEVGGLSEGSPLKRLADELFTRIEGLTDLSPEYMDAMFSDQNIALLAENLKEAIANGTLMTADVRKPHKRAPNIAAGETIIQVMTDRFAMPGSQFSFQARVWVMDQRTSVRPRDKLRLQKIMNVYANRKDELIKLAERVPRKMTHLSEVGFANVLREGYRRAFGKDPTAETLGVAWAQVVLESGRNPIKLPCNNVGNIKAFPAWIKSGKPYYVMSTTDFTGSGKQYAHTGAEWRAYDTPEDGAEGYWRLIGGRYDKALEWMEAGDPTSATVVLGLNKYFTANIKGYSGEVTSLYNTFVKKILPQLSGIVSQPAPPPGRKPAVKEWHDQYSPEELKDVKTGKSTAKLVPQEDKTTEKGIWGEVVSFIKSLFREANGPLESIVKNSILNRELPTTDVLIKIEAETESFFNKVEFARVASDLLMKIADAKVSIHSSASDNTVELQCSVLGSETIVVDAVQALCDCVSDGLSIITDCDKKIKITSTVVPGLISKCAETSFDQLNRSRRAFTLNRIM